MKKVIRDFETAITEEFRRLRVGDPMDPSTQVAPMARPDLVQEIARQVKGSIEAGARLLCGGHPMERPGCYFEPTVLTDVRPGMRVYHEETFGPVVAIIPVESEEEAIKVANDSEFGLGGCVWTKDLHRGERVARQVITGAMFVNGMTKSDPRLPFGGVGKSGYGRELGLQGIREFVNTKTIWIG